MDHDEMKKGGSRFRLSNANPGGSRVGTRTPLMLKVIREAGNKKSEESLSLGEIAREAYNRMPVAALWQTQTSTSSVTAAGVTRTSIRWRCASDCLFRILTDRIDRPA